MRRAIPFYPLVLAALPAVFLYAENTGEGITFVQFLVPSAALMALAALLSLGLRLIIRDTAKASLIASLLILACFTYGPIYYFMAERRFTIAGVFFYAHHFLIPAAVCLTLVLGALVLKYRGNVAPLAQAITLAALVSIAFNAGRIGLYEVETARAGSSPAPANETVSVPFDELPDMYYIILDGYGRADVLKREYGFDNREFLDSLWGKGFYVASESVTNYVFTGVSLASSLNMRYLRQGDPIQQITGENAILRFVQSLGYKYLHLNSGAGASGRNLYADVEFFEKKPIDLLLNEYSALLLSYTIFEPVGRKIGFNINSHLAANQRELFTANMDRLRTIPDVPEPTFTFSHNLPPHPPYIFDREGNVPRESIYEDYRLMWKDTELYIDEIVYVNKVIQEVVDDILVRSAIQPIIVIQSDHGTAKNLPCPTCWNHGNTEFVWERTKILNAFYLPDYCRSGLYPGISPVNSFRVIFNSCLGTDFDLLEDVTWYSRGNRPFVAGKGIKIYPE